MIRTTIMKKLSFNRIKLLAYSIVMVSLPLLGGSAYAQLTVASSGVKTVTLNDSINKNQFIWISTAPLESIKGSAETVTGSLLIDPANLAAMKGTVTALTKSMKTGNATRDNHLWSAEWMNVAKYPTITFKITSVTNLKITGNTATGYANGDFTMHGVTKQVLVPFGMSYIVANAKTRERASGDLVSFNAKFTIALKDYGVAGTEGVVGSKVGETVDITAQLFGNTN